MRQVCNIALLLLVGATLAAAEGPYPKAWMDLFEPPYTATPQIIMSIACVSGKSCLLPGGSNGVGFSLFNFNGLQNGVFTQMQMAGNAGPSFLTSLGAGGTASAPHGVVGGVDFGSTLQYIVNSTNTADSLMMPFFATISISADRATGTLVLTCNELSHSGKQMMFSVDGGMTFTSSEVTGPTPVQNCTFPRYQTIVDNNTWFVTMGSSPASDSLGMKADKRARFAATGAIEVQRTERVSIVRDATGKVERKTLDLIKGEQHASFGESGCPYSAAIQKTNDGGKTWETVFSHVGEYQMNFIDCASPTHCVATGESYNTSTPSARIFTSMDGKTFNQTLELVSTPQEIMYTLTAVQFVPGKPNEVWVAGTTQTATGFEGIFYYSVDGGATWHRHNKLNYIGEITDMSFASDGNGFASAITLLRDSTVLRYTGNGAPATPAPSWTGNFTQLVCNSTDCGDYCQVSTLPQNTCVRLTAGGSMTAKCDLENGVLVQQIFFFSDACSGPMQEELANLNTCLSGQSAGQTVEVVCGSVTIHPRKAAKVEDGHKSVVAVMRHRK